MKKQLSSRKRRAFTLIEMSLVLLIISLLLLVMLPNLNHQKNNADSKVNDAFVKNMETQVMLYQSEKEKIPTVEELLTEKYISAAQKEKIDTIGMTIDHSTGEVTINGAKK